MPLNNAEGGTNGTTVTTGNSGGASGTAWNSVTASGGASAIFDNTNPAHGLLSYLFGATTANASFVAWTITSTGTLVMRAYVCFDTLPGQALRVIDIRNSGGTILRVNTTASNTFQVQEGGTGTPISLTTGTFSAATWYRWEIKISTIAAGTGSYIASCYVKDSLSTFATVTVTTGQLGTTNIVSLDLGSITVAPTSSVTVRIDDCAYDPTMTQFFGPAGPSSLTSHGVATFSATAKLTHAATTTSGGNATCTFGAPVARAATLTAHGVASTTITATVTHTAQVMAAHGVGAMTSTAKDAYKATLTAHGVATCAPSSKVARSVTIIAHGVAGTTVTAKVSRAATLTSHGIAAMTGNTAKVARKATMTAHGQGNLLPTLKRTTFMIVVAHGVGHTVFTAGTSHLMSNNFEGGTNGTTMTGSNTGGSSGDAFSIGTSTGSAAKFDSTIKAHGGMSGKLTAGTAGGASFLFWTVSQATATIRGYVYFDTVPSTSVRIAGIIAGSSTLLRLQLDATHHFQIYEGGSGVTHSVATPVSAGVWYRFEIDLSVVSATIATYKFDYYNLDSLTHVETGVAITGSGNTGTGTITTIDLGSYAAGAPNSWVYHLDDVVQRPSNGAYIGPYTNPVYGYLTAAGKGNLLPTASVKRAGSMTSHGIGFMQPNLGRLKLTIHSVSTFIPRATLAYKASVTMPGRGALHPTAIPPVPPKMGFFFTDIEPVGSVAAVIASISSVKIDLSSSGYVGIFGTQNFIMSGSLFDSVTSTTITFVNQLITVTWTEAGYFASGTVLDVAGDTVTFSAVQIELTSSAGFGVPTPWSQEVIALAPSTAKLAITGGSGQ